MARGLQSGAVPLIRRGSQDQLRRADRWAESARPDIINPFPRPLDADTRIDAAVIIVEKPAVASIIFQQHRIATAVHAERQRPAQAVPGREELEIRRLGDATITGHGVARQVDGAAGDDRVTLRGPGLDRG